jgi:hypothetical protein
MVYLYGEHYQGQGEPHAQAIRARGDWISGVIDPACLGSSQIDGRTLMEVYRKLALHLGAGGECGGGGDHRGVEPSGVGPIAGDGEPDEPASGISQISPGSQRIGKIVKRDDHLMDASGT